MRKLCVLIVLALCLMLQSCSPQMTGLVPTVVHRYGDSVFVFVEKLGGESSVYVDIWRWPEDSPVPHKNHSTRIPGNAASVLSFCCGYGDALYVPTSEGVWKVTVNGECRLATDKAYEFFPQVSEDGVCLAGTPSPSESSVLLRLETMEEVSDWSQLPNSDLFGIYVGKDVLLRWGDNKAKLLSRSSLLDIADIPLESTAQGGAVIGSRAILVCNEHLVVYDWKKNSLTHLEVQSPLGEHYPYIMLMARPISKKAIACTTLLGGNAFLYSLGDSDEEVNVDEYKLGFVTEAVAFEDCFIGATFSDDDGVSYELRRAFYRDVEK